MHITFVTTTNGQTYAAQLLYAASKPVVASFCSKAHHPAYLESFRPPRPLDLLWAAIAAKRSKKSVIILVLASDSTLMGMKVEKASRAKLESGVHGSVSTSSFSTGFRTLFTNFKQLIGFPGDDSSGESTPAPFHHTA